MENVEAGGCAVGAIIGAAGWMLATGGLIVAASSGPIGWGAIAIAFTAKSLAAAGIINSCSY